MTSLSLLEENLDILFTTESWLWATGDESNIRQITPDGYKLLSFPREGGGRGGGIRLTLSPRVVRLPLELSSYEAVQFSLSQGDKTANILCIYRPSPSAKNKLTPAKFLSKLDDSLDFVYLKTNVMLLGDLNIHFDQPEHPLTKQVFISLSVRDLFQHIDISTHCQKHILDPLISRLSDCLISDVKVQEKLISDHCLVSCRLHLPVRKAEKILLTSRNVKGIGRALFRIDLVLPSAMSLTAMTPHSLLTITTRL